MCFIRFNGFSTWTMLPIRANANVNINENKPSDAREVFYYNREQYGSNPLFYGRTLRFCGLDKDNPYLDKAQTTKGTIKLESMRL
jgi:hypothetical protein